MQVLNIGRRFNPEPLQIPDLTLPFLKESSTDHRDFLKKFDGIQSRSVAFQNTTAANSNDIIYDCIAHQKKCICQNSVLDNV